MNTTSTIPVVLDGRGPVLLRQADHLATGGEGSLYRLHDTVVKVYTDAGKMRRDDMDAKLTELMTLAHPYLVTPGGLVRDRQGRAIGYYMRYVDGEPLARVFTNAFWKRASFTLAHASTLVARMREAVTFVHSKQALLVDANELNWLAWSTAGSYEPRVIDVDSFAFGRWPAKVIMPSIRDYHHPDFSRGTDWFAWAVVTFQVYAGIHPYKGSLAGFDQHDLEARMRAQASVFRSSVRLNSAVRDLGSIPGKLSDWYRAVFEHGERGSPPSPFALGASAVQPMRTVRMVTTAQGALTYRKLYAAPNDPVVAVYPAGYVRCASGALVAVATQRVLPVLGTKDTEVVGGAGMALVARVTDGFLDLTCVTEEGPVACPLTVSALRVVQGAGRLFALGEQGLQEVVVRRFGTRPVASLGTVWQVLPYATTWYAEVGVMDALGAKYLVVPMEGGGVAVVRVRELDRLTVVDATAYGRIAVLTVLSGQGTYQRMICYLDASLDHAHGELQPADMEHNVAVLPKGVVALIERDGELTITVPSSGVVRRVEDRGIETTMRLARLGDKVVYMADDALWSLSMT